MELTGSRQKNLHTAKEAFSRQAAIFDALYGNDSMVAYKRKRVREHFEKWLNPGSSILELNAGTGEDAVYLAKKGHRIHATDVSAEMLEKLQAKIDPFNANRLSTECCSFENLAELKLKGPYDAVFSNFGGLNCCQDTEPVLQSLNSLIKPGGIVTLVIIPPFCLWETLLLFRGRFKTAFRRRAGKKGAVAHLEGIHFRCWYHPSRRIEKIMKPAFERLEQEALCCLAPPSYLKDFDLKYPRLFRRLMRLEEKFKKSWPWRNWGDYYIISFRKKTQNAV